MNRRLAPSARYRWMVGSRVLAAAFGGYLLTALVAGDVALLLPRLFDINLASGVMIATLGSFVFYAFIVLWVFAARSTMQTWATLLALSVVAGGAQLLLKGMA